MANAISKTTTAVAVQAEGRTRSRARYKSVVWQSLLIVSLLVILALSFVTIALMFFLSLKDNGQIYGRFWSLPDPVRWENYRDGWLTMRRYIFNSLIYSLASVVGVVFLSSLSGYVFARHKFPGKEIIYVVILALLMVPGVLTLIPAFVLVRELGLINTPWALILPWTAGGQIFGILLCRSFFATLAPGTLRRREGRWGVRFRAVFPDRVAIVVADHGDARDHASGRNLQRFHLAAADDYPIRTSRSSPSA